MGALPQADKFLEVLGHELRPVVANEPRPSNRISFPSTLDDNLGVGLPHLGTDIPGQDSAGSPIEHRAKIVKGPSKVDIGKIHVPVLMRLQWLNETLSFARGRHQA